MEKFIGDFSKFINNVKTTDKELAKKFTSDVKTYCKKNNIEITSAIDELLADGTVKEISEKYFGMDVSQP